MRNPIAAFFDALRDGAGWVLRGLMRLLEQLTPLALILGVATLLFDMISTRQERDSSAWQLLASDAPGSSGKKEALEHLNAHNPLLLPEPIGAGRAIANFWMSATSLGDAVKPPVQCKLDPDDSPDGYFAVDFGPWKKQNFLDGIDLSLRQKPDPETGRCKSSERTLLIGVDLNGAQMRGANLTCVDLGSDFVSAVDASSPENTDGDLSKKNRQTKASNLNFSCLDQATFSGANLKGASLASVSLQGADLTFANLQGTALAGATAHDADFSNADIDSKTTFTKAAMNRAKFVRTVILDRGQIDFSGAKLRNSRFKLYALNANFAGADLSGSHLASINFLNSNFSKTVLEGANLSGSDLSNVVGLNVNVFGSACGDQYTVLPKGFPPAKLCAESGFEFSARTISMQALKECQANAHRAPTESFDGVVKAVTSYNVLCLAVANEKTIAVVERDITEQPYVNGFDERDITEYLKSMLASEGNLVKCVTTPSQEANKWSALGSVDISSVRCAIGGRSLGSLVADRMEAKKNSSGPASRNALPGQ